MMQPSYSREVPNDFPIQVDEAGQKVTVQAGITQRALLDYLAAYKCVRKSGAWTFLSSRGAIVIKQHCLGDCLIVA